MRGTLPIATKLWMSALFLLSLLMVGLIIVPSDAWHHPVNDQVYHGFDPNTLFVDLKGAGFSKGLVQTSEQKVEISALPESAPTVNLATTPFSRLNASVDVLILGNPPGSQPLRIGLWSPLTESGYFVVFGEGPASLITSETISNGSLGPTLVGGNRTGRVALGNYTTGQVYHLSIGMERERQTIMTTLWGGGTVLHALASGSEVSKLFASTRVSLTVSASSSSGTTKVLLNNYQLALPHERFFADKVDDPRVTFALLALGGLGAIAIAITILRWLPQSSIRVVGLALGTSCREIGAKLYRPKRLVVFGAVVIGAYVVPNVVLFTQGSHPFDMADEKLYAYVAVKSGLAQLYYLPNVVSFPAVWGGIPYQEAAFPYEPILGYVFAGIGWLLGMILGSGSVAPHSISLEYVIKAVNVMFGLADSILIYLILRQLKVSQRWSLIATALFLFNPAVWFSMSIWGQTHVISLAFALAVIFLAERGHPTAAWVLLAPAAVTRPQMLVFGFLMGIVLLRTFSLKDNLRAMSWAFVGTFMLMLPFMLGTSPSLPIDVMSNTLRIQEGGGNDPTLTTVSQDAYSIWPLVTYAAHGASGLYRSFTPSAGALIGGVSYQRVGQILTIGALLVLAGLLLFQRRWTRSPGEYIPLIALGMVSFLMFTTGLVATHFVLALPFLLLCRKWLSTSAYFFIVLAWTVTTLVPMYGDMGNVISHLDYPLSPSNNVITAFFMQLYSWDRFITLGTLANIGALIWLAVTAVRQASRPEHTLASAAVS